VKEKKMAFQNSRPWISLAKTLVGISLLASILLWNNNAQQLLSVFANFKPEYLVALAIIGLGLNVVSSIKWSLFLHDRGMDVSQLRLLSLYLIGKFFNNFLPSMFGGDVARAYMLGRSISSHAIATASVFLERITGLIGLAFLAGFFSLINFKILANPIISLSVVGAILGCGIGIALFYWPSFKDFVLKINRSIPIANKFTPKIERFINAVAHFRARHRLLLLSLLFSVAFHVLASINVYVTCLSIDFIPPFADILVITPVILMLAMIPISPNNIGWWEWCFTILLADAGATAAQGLAVALTLRAMALAISLIGGVLFLYQRQTQSSGT
jgi:uncharacterized protein (TIRG00374 family)